MVVTDARGHRTGGEKLNPRIILLASGLAAHGGIQRYNRTLCKALTEYAAGHAATLHVLSLHDPPGWYDARYLAAPVMGCGGRRLQFAARALAALAQPHDLAIVGHVDFGPLTVPAHLRRPRAPVMALTYGKEVWTRLRVHERTALRAAGRVCAISAYTAERLASEQGIDRARIAMLPCAIDPEFLTDLAAWRASDWTGRCARLLTISRLSKADVDKGVDRVIAALAEVRRRVPDAGYVVVGDGDDRPRLERLAREYGVDDVVSFVGQVPNADLHAFLAGADVLVLPSRKEGFGIVFLEAMAHGKPVIAGAHGGSPEVVVDGVTGLLVRHQDHAGLVAAVTELLTDAERRRAMGEAGLQRVHSVYSYASFQTTLARMLDTIMSVPHRQGAWSDVASRTHD